MCPITYDELEKEFASARRKSPTFGVRYYAGKGLYIRKNSVEDCFELLAVSRKWVHDIKEHGYSNYTVEESIVYCALDCNPNLVCGTAELPWDWSVEDRQKHRDNWPATAHSMCENYTHFPDRYAHVRIPVELDEPIAHMVDEPVYRAIVDHHKRLNGKHPEEYV